MQLLNVNSEIVPMSFPWRQNVFLNPRLLSILCLGFASGLPLALTGTTLQAWFTAEHLSLMAIGALTLLGLPYLLKFLWAPLMDFYRFPILGKRKGWILLTQLFLGLFLLLLANLNPLYNLKMVAVTAFCIAILSASQDISINAYQADILEPQERGLGASYMTFTYRLAMLVSGGFALIMADYDGWRFTYETMAILMFFTAVLTYFLPTPKEVTFYDPLTGKDTLYVHTLASLNDLLSREKIFWILLFVILYKFGDALSVSLLTNFLLNDLHFSLSEIGVAYKVVGFIATILGTFFGGLFLVSYSLYTALFFFGLAQAFSTILFVVLAMVGKQFVLLSLSIFVENFCSGLSTAALFALMMTLCDHRFTATQFALLTALDSLGRVLLGPVASVIVLHVGWINFYILSVFMSIPGLLCLFMIKKRVFEYAPIPQH